MSMCMCVCVCVHACVHVCMHLVTGPWSSHKALQSVFVFITGSMKFKLSSS